GAVPGPLRRPFAALPGRGADRRFPGGRNGPGRTKAEPLRPPGQADRGGLPPRPSPPCLSRWPGSLVTSVRAASQLTAGCGAVPIETHAAGDLRSAGRWRTVYTTTREREECRAMPRQVLGWMLIALGLAGVVGGGFMFYLFSVANNTWDES